MTTPLTREAVYGWITHNRNRGVHINAGVLSDLATALLAAWDERDAMRKEFDAVVAMLSEMHGAEYSRAEAAEEDITTYQEIVSAMTQEAEAAEAKLVECDARLREAATGLAKWVICNIPSGEVVDEKLRALDAALTGDKP